MPNWSSQWPDLSPASVCLLGAANPEKAWVNSPTRANGIGSVQGFLALISRSSTRSIERASHLCANPSCITCGGLELGLKVLDLNAEGLLKIPGAM
jgi:hypothetical protein